jgi:circadian clock protein KaiB
MPSEDDAKDKLEQAIEKRKTEKYILILYISGTTPKAKRALVNLNKIIEENFKDRYELEVIDIKQHPEKAKSANIIATPTLIKKLPPPLRRYIGDLAESEKVLVALEIKERNNE